MNRRGIALFIAIVATGVLVAAVIAAFRQGRQAAVVIPGGITYLGEKPTATPVAVQNPSKSPAPSPVPVFTAPASAPLKTMRGKIYPYEFRVPETLPLVIFPDDPTDAIGIDWGGRKPQESVLLNVIDISKIDALKPYVGKPALTLVTDWWKQYPGLSGISTVSAFTNPRGLKGYSAAFVNTRGEAPNIDMFFPVPGSNTLIIRMGSGVLDHELFLRIVDTLSWGSR